MFIYVSNERWTDKYICHEDNCKNCAVRFKCYTTAPHEEEDGFTLGLDEWADVSYHHDMNHIRYCCRLVTGTARSGAL